MEKTISSERLFDGRIIKLRVDQVELPDKKITTREIIEHPGATAIIAIDDCGKIPFVRQYRKPVEKYLLEIPAGKLEAGEVPEECAKREFEEETGYTVGSISKLMTFYTTPGFSNEVIHLFLATGLKKGVQNLDFDEHIENLWYSLSEAMGMVYAGTIEDAKTIIALMALNNAVQQSNAGNV